MIYTTHGSTKSATSRIETQKNNGEAIYGLDKMMDVVVVGAGTN